MMAQVLEHRNIGYDGLELIVQKQGALLLKQVVSYTLFMTKVAVTKNCLSQVLERSRTGHSAVTNLHKNISKRSIL